MISHVVFRPSLQGLKKKHFLAEIGVKGSFTSLRKTSSRENGTLMNYHICFNLAPKPINANFYGST